MKLFLNFNSLNIFSPILTRHVISQTSVIFFFFKVNNIKFQASLWLKGEAGKSFNCSVSARLGVSMFESASAFHAGDFDAALAHILPARYEVQELLGGSHAQRDVVEQMVLRAAVGAGRRELAEQLLRERMAQAPRVSAYRSCCPVGI